MKKLHFLTSLVFLALCFTTYAQSEKEGSYMMGQGKEMMQPHQGGMGEMDMMKGKEMHQKMSPCMNRMQNMMQKMDKMMGKDMNSEDRAKLADIMKDMSEHMMDMSVMMKKGQCRIEEMEKLDKDVSDTDQRFKELEDYL